MSREAHKQLVARACAAVRAAAKAPPTASASGIADELAESWTQFPLRIGVRGEPASRLELFAAAAGAALANAGQRTAPFPALTLVRADAGRYRVTHADGRIEAVVAPADDTPPEDDDADEDDDRDVEIEVVREPEPEPAAPAAPPDTRPTYVRERPPFWALWLWILRWIYLATHRAPELPAPAPAPVSEAIVEPVAVESSNAVTIVAIPSGQDMLKGIGIPPLQGYSLRLANVVSGSGVGAGATRVAIEVAGGPLPRGVELVELLDDAPGSSMDLVVAVKQQTVYVVDVHDERVHRVGPLDRALPELRPLALEGRAHRLAWRAIDVLHSLEATLGDIIASADARFRGRIAELEELRIDDPQAVLEEHMVVVRPEVTARASAIVKHVLAEVGADLDRLDAAWTYEITEATGLEALQTAVAKIDRESPASLGAVASDARRLLASSIAGTVHDLLPSAIAPVTTRGLAADQLRDLANVPVPEISCLGKLADAGGTGLGAVGGNWLTNLLTSYDARRSDALSRLRARVGTLRELAMAETLDVEPRLHAVVEEAVRALVAGAIERHATWLDERLAAERSAVATEREAMSALILARDNAHDDALSIASSIAAPS